MANASAATTLVVSTTADTSASSGACGSSSITTAPSPLSLREATCLANNIGGEVNISVPAGTYKLENGELQPGTHSGQTVNISGASAASTVIDGMGKGIVLNIDESNLGGVNSTLTNLTVTGGASDKYGGAGIVDGSNTKPFDALTLRSVAVRGNVANTGVPLATNKYGGGVQLASGKLIVENSVIAENSSHSSPGGGIAYFSRVNAPGQGVIIRNTVFEGNKMANASEFEQGGAGLWINAIFGEVEISGTSFVNNEATASGSGAVSGAGLMIRSGTTTVVGSTFTGNTVKSTGSGPARGAAVAVTSALPEFPGTLAMHYDRIAGNSPGASAVANIESTVNATENWWGCNGAPGSAGCDGVSGTATTSPHLQLNASGSPTMLAGPNAASTLTADFLTDSAGGAVAPTNLTAFTGAPVTWSDPQPSPATINGKASPQTSATPIAAGKATATYDSTSSAGAGHAVATFDNAAKTIALTVDRKPEVTTNPSDQQVPPGGTASFSAAASGTPTPTVQWQRDTGSGTFTNIPEATSTTYAFTAQSSESGYRYRAVFTNTIEGSPYTATTTAATLIVGKLTPTLTSSATGASLGNPVHDTATLSGGSSPTGTITFEAFGSADASCTGTAVSTSSASVTGAGSYESSAYTPPGAGEYHWVVTYSGDSHNEEVKAACGAANETSAVTKATTSLGTVASNETLGGNIHDIATLGGGHSPGGSITFKAYGPNDSSCTGTAISTSTVSVSGNGGYESESFTPGEAGAYRWIATYTGDANNQGAAGSCGTAGETSTVGKASPQIATTATTGTIGTAVHDAATLSGGFSAGGSITFNAFGPADSKCTNAPVFTSTVSVSGNGSFESESFTPTEAGAYRWIATYTGDANNQAVAGTCGDAGETSTIAQASPSLSTTATDATLGGQIHDGATLGGAHSPGGSITFEAFGPNDSSCTGTAISTSTVAVTGNGSYESNSFTPGEAGAYHWVATYSGDTNNQEASRACGATGETSSVGRTTPSLATNASSAVVGSSVHDTATLSGGVSAGGSITFKAFSPGDTACATPISTSTDTISGNGSYESESISPSEAGQYRWVATYSGDANNEAVGGACGDTGETSTMAKASPSIATAAVNGTAGGQIHDTATLSSGVGPAGIVTFDVYGPGDVSCGHAVSSLTVAVSGNGSYESGAFSPTEAGEYRWVASYSGDGNNDGASGACGDTGENSTVGKASPALATGATSAAVGSPVHDTATLSAGVSAGGTITFEAYAPGDAACATPVSSSTATVSGNGSYDSGSLTPTEAGAYRWIATYSGDANNQAAAGACGDTGETSTIAKASPSLSTAATDAALGGSVHDTATLSGGYAAGGSITFEAFGAADAACAGSPVFTKTVAVSGDGGYGSTDYTPIQVGEYHWVATYSGDANNEAVGGACGDTGETSSVGKATPTMSTAATAATVGWQIHDSAALSGGQAPGGTITFKAFGPADTTCSRAPVFTDTVPVAGAASYESRPYSPGQAGTYRWIATYSGDANNASVSAACGDVGETSTVSPLPAVPATPVSPAPQTCTPAAPSAGGYVPKKKTKGHFVAGVRARINVAEPSEIEVATTLHYRKDGVEQSVDLGAVSLENPGARNVRIPLPASLRESLPLGTKVRLSLRISSTPAAGCSAATPHKTKLVVRTEVVRILAAG